MKYIIATFALLITSTTISQVTPLWTRYPTISPDGSQIAFSYMGDIYVVPAEGGQAIQITSHPGYDFAPIWSHNGKTIAFASDRYGNSDIFLVSASGGEVTRLTYHSMNDMPWSFAPDNSKILFSSLRQDHAESALFPSGILSELYAVPVKGGRIEQVLGVPAEHASYSPDGSSLIYQDRKGYEDPWRKHHTSYVTRDIWIYSSETGTHKKITNWLGEDRNPVFSNGSIYFLSERTSNNSNIWKTNFEGANPVQVTSYTDHPVRFLSISNSGTICYFYRGSIYTMPENGKPEKVTITVSGTDKSNEIINLPVKDHATEIVLSPNEKEIAFVVRGEIYVTSIDHTSTKRITDTPNQERNISFSPDGSTILYASERNGSWNIYETSIKNKDEKYFFLSTVLQEKGLVIGDVNTFQPAYSPDGKEIAYLTKRTGIEIKNLASGKTRMILQPDINYSYSDGDQWFRWSPDGNWIATEYMDNNRWMSDIAIIPTDGKGKAINLTESGYGEGAPMWMDHGNILMFFSDRYGKRSQASWGAETDVFAIYLNQKTYDKYNLPEDEYELKYGKLKDKEDNEPSDVGKKEKSTSTIGAVEKIVIETKNIEDRIKRLTIHSSNLAGAVLSAKGDELYYLSEFEKGYDLWSHDLIKNETKLVAKLNGHGFGLEADKKVENLYVLDQGKIYKIDVKAKSGKKPVSFSSYMNFRPYDERRYIFEHAWRQVKEKFYVKDLHGVDWETLKTEYEQFLPHISNGYDFAELLSEMLGELNASHTGARFGDKHDNPDRTASLGVIYDHTHKGDGLKVLEILPTGPFAIASSKVIPGTIITSINGVAIKADMNYNELLNNIENQPTQIGLTNKSGSWTETIRPISFGEEYALLYKRWVKRNQEFTEKYSGGKIAYVHVRGMNEASYRTIYSDLMGKYHDYDAVVIDTRFNGGGWLHDDLATFLSGKTYLKFSPRGQENMGGEPLFKWNHPSIVLMSEGNYSDAHMFPYVYRALGIGKLVGMPVAGTGTAVWWERQIDGLTVFGIPQVGMKGNDGKLLENQDLIPDVQIENNPQTVVTGEDKQLKAAIDELLITGTKDH